MLGRGHQSHHLSNSSDFLTECAIERRFQSDHCMQDSNLLIAPLSGTSKKEGGINRAGTPGVSTQRHVCVPLGIEKMSSRAFQRYMTCIYGATWGCHIPLESSWAHLSHTMLGFCVPPMQFLPASLQRGPPNFFSFLKMGLPSKKKSF